ncbi:MAG: hypothetical protein ACOYK1_04710 [Vampirovibrionia bacterium]
MNTTCPSTTTGVDFLNCLYTNFQKGTRINQVDEARVKLIKKYESGDDSALDKLILLNQHAKAENIPLTDKQRQVLQNELKASKAAAAHARESVGANSEKLAAIDMIEKRSNTIYDVAINQSVEKP